MTQLDRRTELLNHAQALVQQRGFNAFSFKDLALAVGIRTPSVHHHFPTKQDLAHALMTRYIEQLNRVLKGFELKPLVRERVQALIDLHRSTQQKGIACLCGSLMTDIDTLPESVLPLVRTYLERTQHWVVQQLDDGQQQGEFRLALPAEDAASMLVSGLQGALFTSRVGLEHDPLIRIERVFWSMIHDS